TLVLSLFDPLVISSITTNEVVVTNTIPGSTNTMTVTNYVVVYGGSPGYLDTYEHHTLTILDDDLSIVNVEATLPDAYEEGPLPGEFTFSRTAPPNPPPPIH